MLYPKTIKKTTKRNLLKINFIGIGKKFMLFSFHIIQSKDYFESFIEKVFHF